jgi:branched-chain amino acid aminotransferase
VPDDRADLDGILSLAIWRDGEIVGPEAAVVSVWDHGFLYGDGVFEGIRVYHGKVFRLKEHMGRLYDSARSIALEIPMGREELAKAVEETVKINERRDGYIRLIVTRGTGTLGLDPRKCDSQVIIIVDGISLYPEELYENGLEIITAATIRSHPAALSPRVKSLNYLNNILAKIEGTQAGCLEALMLNHKGEVSECTGDNVFLMKHGELRTPPIDAGILEGVTRNAVIELARKAGMTVKEMVLTRHDVFTADELFLTGTAAEIIPVVKCDGRPIGAGKPGPVFKRLREMFKELVKE